MRLDGQDFCELRARAVDARQMPCSQTQTWEKAPADPMHLLGVFAPALRLRAGWVLRGYRISGGLGGRGLVYALPTDAPFPEPCACMKKVTENHAVPRPPDAIAAYDADFADVVENDGTPWSYACTSLFVREARAFGEEWHAIVWGNRVLLVRDPSAPDAWEGLPAPPTNRRAFRSAVRRA